MKKVSEVLSELLQGIEMPEETQYDLERQIERVVAMEKELELVSK
jgi:hypothetical protein